MAKCARCSTIEARRWKRLGLRRRWRSSAWKVSPQAGDQFVVVADREKARGISDYREQKAREAALAKSSRVSLEGLAEQLKSAGTKELNIILKGDVGGSVEVLTDLLIRNFRTTRYG